MATPKQLEQVRDLAKEAESLQYRQISPWFDKHWTELLDPEKRLVWVVLDGDKVVGYLIAKINTDSRRKNSIKVSRLFVKPEYGDEVESALLTRLEKFAVDNGKSTIYGHIFVGNESRVQLLQRHGYTFGKRRGEDAEKRIEAYFMVTHNVGASRVPADDSPKRFLYDYAVADSRMKFEAALPYTVLRARLKELLRKFEEGRGVAVGPEIGLQDPASTIGKFEARNAGSEI